MVVALWRDVLGSSLRRVRLRQGRTLRDVSAAARVSLGYLSEIERGRKEPSSELLAAICAALGVTLSDVLFDVLGTLPLQAEVLQPAVAFDKRAAVEALAA
jgi:transcriptional regulator with XRE-family HTH domain